MALKTSMAWAAVAGVLFAGWPAFATDGRLPTWLDIPVTMQPIAMHSPPVADADRKLGSLRFVAGYELHSPHRAFGGLSGIEISDDGRHVLGISDRGQWLWMEFDLDGDGPKAVTMARMAPILDEEGTPLPRGWRDSESLVLDDGRVLVGFEGHDLVRSFSLSAGRGDGFGKLDSLPAARGAVPDLPPDMLKHPRNGGLEAMVRLQDGALLAFSEMGRGGDGHLKAWLYKDGKAHALSLAVPQGFHSTDAALLPDNDVLVLLRHFSLWGGLAAQIIRIKAADIVPGTVLAGEVLATLRPPLSVDNMEGLAVRRSRDGDVLVYMVSDDNFLPFQRTLLLIYALSD